MPALPAVPRPGTWASTTSSGWTSPGCASTGSARAKAALEASECGAFLLFDFYNIRYTTQTWIGGALGDKMTRYALLTREARTRCCGTSGRPSATTSSTPVAARRELPGRGCSGSAVRSRRRSG